MVTIDQSCQHAAQHLLVFDPIQVMNPYGSLPSGASVTPYSTLILGTPYPQNQALSLRSGNLYLPMAIWVLALEEVIRVRP